MIERRGIGFVLKHLDFVGSVALLGQTLMDWRISNGARTLQVKNMTIGEFDGVGHAVGNGDKNN